MKGVRFVSGRYSRGSGAAKDSGFSTKYREMGANVGESRLGTPRQYGNKTKPYQGERYGKSWRGRGGKVGP